MASMARFYQNRPVNKSRPRSICLGALFVIAAALSEAKAALGDLPLVNNLQGTSTFNLNFSQASANQQIALFLINSNDPSGFSVTFTFANKGAFAAGSRNFSMASIVLDRVSGTLGSGLTEPVDELITLDAGGAWTWSPGNSPTTETVNYIIEIKVTWPDPSPGLAGLYLESINAVITGGP